MQAHYWWWLIALGMGVLELLTGTFYLLLLAVACVAGGLAAYGSVGVAGQLLCTALVAVAGWFGLQKWHPVRNSRGDVTSNRDVLLDIGERVQVARWDENGRSQVSYRGANWAVEIDPSVRSASAPPQPGEFEIRSVTGNRLIIAPPSRPAATQPR
jgi:membrane protein implicated in regulation of membrane protease activity